MHDVRRWPLTSCCLITCKYDIGLMIQDFSSSELQTTSVDIASIMANDTNTYLSLQRYSKCYELVAMNYWPFGLKSRWNNLHNQSFKCWSYIYIYIYVCVCVCVTWTVSSLCLHMSSHRTVWCHQKAQCWLKGYIHVFLSKLGASPPINRRGLNVKPRIRQNVFENGVHEISAILFRFQCVTYMYIQEAQSRTPTACSVSCLSMSWTKRHYGHNKSCSLVYHTPFPTITQLFTGHAE